MAAGRVETRGRAKLDDTADRSLPALDERLFARIDNVRQLAAPLVRIEGAHALKQRLVFWNVALVQKRDERIDLANFRQLERELPRGAARHLALALVAPRLIRSEGISADRAPPIPGVRGPSRVATRVGAGAFGVGTAPGSFRFQSFTMFLPVSCRLLRAVSPHQPSQHPEACCKDDEDQPQHHFPALREWPLVPPYFARADHLVTPRASLRLPTRTLCSRLARLVIGDPPVRPLAADAVVSAQAKTFPA